MYDNIGKKIKVLAKAVFIVEAICAIIGGIITLITDEDLILFGILLLFLGPLVAWVSSWLLYGFGELIDKVGDIELNTHGMAKNSAQPKLSAERIDTLNRLLSKGLITEEEYQKTIQKEQ